MIDLIISFLNYIKIFLSCCIFTYAYKFLYDSCIEKKIIKTKDNKPKKVVKTRITMSFFYLFLLFLLFSSLEWVILKTIFLMCVLLSTISIHKFEKQYIDTFKNFESNTIMKKCWFLFSFLMGIVFKIFGPFHKVIDSKIDKLIGKGKQFFSKGLINNLSEQYENINKFNIKDDFIKFEKIFNLNNLNDKSNDKLNDKSNNKSNDKSNDTIDNTINEKNDIVNFINNMDAYKSKIDNSGINIDDDINKLIYNDNNNDNNNDNDSDSDNKLNDVDMESYI